MLEDGLSLSVFSVRLYYVTAAIAFSSIRLDGLEERGKDQTRALALVFTAGGTWLWSCEWSVQVSLIEKYSMAHLDRKVWCSKRVVLRFIYAGIVTGSEDISAQVQAGKMWGHWNSLKKEEGAVLDLSQSVSAFPSWDWDHCKFSSRRRRIA